MIDFKAQHVEIKKDPIAKAMDVVLSRDIKYECEYCQAIFYGGIYNCPNCKAVVSHHWLYDEV